MAPVIRKNRTNRVVDGGTIPGTWRQLFIRSGRDFLTQLFVYADGTIDCWGPVDLEGLRAKIASGGRDIVGARGWAGMRLV